MRYQSLVSLVPQPSKRNSDFRMWINELSRGNNEISIIKGTTCREILSWNIYEHSRLAKLYDPYSSIDSPYLYVKLAGNISFPNPGIENFLRKISSDISSGINENLFTLETFGGDTWIRVCENSSPSTQVISYMLYVLIYYEKDYLNYDFMEVAKRDLISENLPFVSNRKDQFLTWAFADLIMKRKIHYFALSYTDGPAKFLQENLFFYLNDILLFVKEVGVDRVFNFLGEGDKLDKLFLSLLKSGMDLYKINKDEWPNEE